MPRARIPVVFNPQPAVSLAAGPWSEVWETTDEGVRKATRMVRAVNLLPKTPHPGSRWTQRPGYGRAALATLSGRTYGRCIHQHTSAAGVNTLLAFFDQKMYTVTPSAVTEVVLAGAGVTLTAPVHTGSETFPIHCVSFADKVVVQPNDGLTKPFTYDPATGTFASLVNAPISYGKPAVYYGKLFFIKSAARDTIVWSEEGDPTTGYEAGGATNVWQLRQSSGEGLTAILGTNEALFYWRSNAFDRIIGAVDDEFSTSGTVAGINATIGTMSADAVILLDQSIYFPDQHGRIQRYDIGGGLAKDPAFWEGATQTLSYVMDNTVPGNRRGLPAACARYWPAADVLLFLMPGAAAGASYTSSVSRLLLAFSPSRGYMGEWSNFVSYDRASTLTVAGFDAHTLGVGFYGNSGSGGSAVPRLLHLSTQPWAWHQPGIDETAVTGLPYYLDAWNGSTSQPINWLCDPGLLGVPGRECQYQTITWEGRSTFVTSNPLSVSVAHHTPYAATATAFSTAQTKSIPVADGSYEDVRYAVGISNQGRWLRPRFYSSASGTSSASRGDMLSVSTVTVLGSLLPLSRGDFR